MIKIAKIGIIILKLYLLLSNKKQPHFWSCFLLCERVRGIEPLSRPWQGRIITTIRYPHKLYKYIANIYSLINPQKIEEIMCRGRESNPHCVATTGF